MYIYQYKDWPRFTWDEAKLLPQLIEIRHRQGRLLGRMEALGFQLREEAVLQTMTLEIIKTSEIEGEKLDTEQVRSSVARKLGMDVAGLILADRNVEGIVDMIMDATQRYKEELNDERLFGWHSALFPIGRSGMYKIVVGNWRDNKPDSPMQVVSGTFGKEKVHFQAPDGDKVANEMEAFFTWFNSEFTLDPVLKSAITHLWFVTIHPFDNGNGRIARTIADMQLARADGTSQRFYSMSAQISQERNAYYKILEKTQKGRLDITEWIEWFLGCLDRSIIASDQILARVMHKARFWEYLATKNLNDRQRLMIKKMLDGFDGKMQSSKWAKITKASQDTAARDIQNLIEQGVLEKEEGGGRSTSYRLIEL